MGVPISPVGVPIFPANNATYLDYLEVLLGKQISKQGNLQDLMIRYLSEIPSDLSVVNAEIGGTDKGYLFLISADNAINAIGHLRMT